MRFPRTIRLDLSDTRVFAGAAEPGEWAVTGAFRFAHRDAGTLKGKEVQSFKHGWLGLDSFADCTLVEVAEIAADELEAVTRRLAAFLLDRYGAPDVLQAVEAAQQEVEFAASLCGHPLRTVLSLEREFNEQGLIERVRVIEQAPPGRVTRVWNATRDE